MTAPWATKSCSTSTALISAADFNAFRIAYGGTGMTFDFNDDGVVTAADFMQFRLRYGVTI